MFEYGDNGVSKNKLLLESNLISVKETPGNLVKNAYFDNGLDNWIKIAHNDVNDCVINVDNNNVYKQYKELADKEKNVIFGGRLAEYKYYDMHQIVEEVLKRF